MIKKIKILLLLAILISVVKLYGQSITINPIGWPFPNDSIQAMTSDSSLLYVAHRNNSFASDSITISIWNGNTWTSIPVPKCSCSNFKVHDMAVYSGGLYIAGQFNNITGISGATSIMRYNGATWIGVNGGISNSSPTFPNSIINHLEVYNNLLFAAGSFDSIGNSNADHIAQWNGTNWNNIGPTTISNEIIALEALDGKLYASIGGTVGNLIEVSQSNATIITFASIQEIHAFGVYNGNLFIRDRLNNTFVANGNQLISRYFPQGGTGFTAKSPMFKTHKGVLYNFNDFINSSPISRVLSQYDGINWSQAPLSVSGSGITEFNESVTYKGDLIVAGNTAAVSGFDIGKFSTGNYNISGKVYEDNNADCIFNGADRGQQNRVIEILPGPHYAVTNDTGYYSIDLPDSVTYTLNLLTDSIGLGKYWQNTICSPVTQTVILNKNDTVNFSLEATQSVSDIKVELTGSMSWRARQGFIQRYYIDVTNIGTVTSNNIGLKLTHDSLNFLAANVLPNTSSLDSLDWNLPSLNANETNSLTVDFRVPTGSTTLGSTIGFVAIVSTNSDVDFTNNIDTLLQTVVAAIDPNDKQTNPVGKISENQNYIDYQIRYQNTGSDTAIKVVVVDTVDNKLPLTSIVMQSLTHSYTIKVQNNAIIWTFDNIMLPHLGSDSLGSIGHIKYRAYIAPGLAKGDTITNRADIYFDFQQLLKTNTVINWVPKDISIEERGELSHLLNVYPNPSSNNITLEYSGTDDRSLLLINSLGQKILAVDVRAHIPKTIDISNLPSGFYFIRSADSSIVFKLLVN